MKQTVKDKSDNYTFTEEEKNGINKRLDEALSSDDVVEVDEEYWKEEHAHLNKLAKQPSK